MQFILLCVKVQVAEMKLVRNHKRKQTEIGTNFFVNDKKFIQLRQLHSYSSFDYLV